MEQGKIAKFLKATLKEWAAPSEQSVPAPPALPPAPVAAPGPITAVLVERDESKISYDKVLAQGMQGSFSLLPQAELKAARDQFQLITGLAVEEEERPSDEQLSALKAWLTTAPGQRKNAPFVDFAIWGPYNKMTLQERKFCTMHLRPGGAYSETKLPGPSSFGEWLKGWAVFRSAMLMLGAASPGELELYVKGIRQLVDRFPGKWVQISSADRAVRFDLWGRMYEDLIYDDVAFADEPNPWGKVIAQSSYKSYDPKRQQWWYDNLVIYLGAATPGSSSVATGAAALPVAGVPPPPSWVIGVRASVLAPAVAAAEAVAAATVKASRRSLARHPHPLSPSRQGPSAGTVAAPATRSTTARAGGRQPSLSSPPSPRAGARARTRARTRAGAGAARHSPEEKQQCQRRDPRRQHAVQPPRGPRQPRRLPGEGQRRVAPVGPRPPVLRPPLPQPPRSRTVHV